MTTVLVTRPAAEALQLASKLQTRGYQTVIEPLLTIMTTGAPRPPQQNIGAVLITSRNALGVLEPRRKEIEYLLPLPCYCVGLRTAEAARAFGFAQVRFSEGEGTDLSKLVIKKAPTKETLLHIAGDEVAGAMQRLLKEAGFQVAVWPVYKAEASSALSPALRQELIRKKIDSVLFFSPHTAAQFVRLIKQHELQACCTHLTAIGLSDAVVAALRPLSWRHSVAAEAPTENAVVACLQCTCPVS